MDRPGSECTTELDLAIGFLARPRAVGVEDKSGPGRCRHRRSWIEKVEKAEMAPHPDYQRSSRSGRRCVESLASVDTASVVRPACKGFGRTPTISTVCLGIAGRTSGA